MMQSGNNTKLKQHIAATVATGLLTAVHSGVWAQASNTESEQRSQAEQRRQQEREQLQRQQLQPGADVHLGAPAAAPAARLPRTESPCFRITHIALVGDVPEGWAQWLLPALNGAQGDDSPLFDRSGVCLGTQGIAIVLQRAQEALVAKGFVTSRVLVQGQDLSTGTLALTVVPGRVRAVRLDSAAASVTAKAPASVRTAVPVQAGDILNLRDIEQGLENFKRVPTADADIQITPASQPDQSDLLIQYSQAFPLRASLALDDSGSKATGKYQGSATVSWDNPLGLNDLFYVSSNHDAGGGDSGPRGTRGTSAHYSVPFGYWTVGTTLSDSRYYQTVAGLNQNYVYSGTSGSTEIKLSRLVYRDAVRKTSLSLKAFERHSNNYIDDTEVQVQRRVVGGWELGLGHKEFVGSATVEANVAYKRGTSDFGAMPAPEEATGEGTARMGLWTADVALTQPFKLAAQALRYNATLRLQGNETALTPQDRFSIGGRYTVRGFDGESSLSGDRGWLLRQDVSLALGASGQETYLGVDAGEVGGQSSELLAGKSLSGAVIGLRGSFKKLQYDLFVGAPLYQPAGVKTAQTTAGFSLNLSF